MPKRQDHWKFVQPYPNPTRLGSIEIDLSLSWINFDGSRVCLTKKKCHQNALGKVSIRFDISSDDIAMQKFPTIPAVI